MAISKPTAESDPLVFEDFHWHSGKDLQEKKRSLLTDSERKKGDWQRQKYMAFLHRYAESLAGSVASETVIVREQQLEDQKANKKEDAALRKKGPTVKSKADQIREANVKKRKDDAHASSMVQLRELLKRIQQVPDLDRRVQQLTDYLKNCKSDEPALEASLHRLRLMEDLLASELRSGAPQDPKCVSRAVATLRCLFSLLDRSLLVAQKTQETPAFNKLLVSIWEFCHGYLLRLGFSHASRLLLSRPCAPPFKPPATVHDSRPPFTTFCHLRFQLEHMGPVMERNTEGQLDGRVSFTPDKWQTQLLDIIDRHESALVCAPTSSGKTFVSYYAMRKVLEQDWDGVVVYVAPTKALVNQVSAEVYARFSRVPTKDGQSVVGVFTRDYRHDYLRCRILVTVPQCFEILLLSPAQQKTWTPRIRYVIFDEIHSIGEVSGGACWEHLLLMIPSPFVALSATVGNPAAFHQWLDRARQAYGQKVHLVRHDARYSELRKMVLVAELTGGEHLKKRTDDDDDEIKIVEGVGKGTDEAQDGREAEEKRISLRFQTYQLHPAAMLSARQLKIHGFPADLAFESRDTLRLYDAMAKFAAEPDDKAALATLSPDVFFPSHLSLTQADARRYETAVKDLFVRWAKQSKEALVERVLAEIGDGVRDRLLSLEQRQPFCLSRRFLLHSMLPAVRQLQRLSLLPAIVFSFDRTLCTTFCVLICDLLAQQEAAARKGRRPQNSTPSKKQQRMERRLGLDAELDEPQTLKESSVDPDLPDDDFSFVPRNEAMPIGEIKELLQKERLVGRGCDHLLPALFRGIGVHHGGLPKKYQQVVEVLFRRRHLRVVFATGTLALGINMPCPTVVFAGDSNFLNALQYRQMSGRAGRRGFDDLGHVVFFGLPQAKIGSLLSSALPTLRGHFPLTVTTVLRAFQLLSETSGAQHKAAERSVSNLLRVPFFASGKPYLEEQMAHHFRFSIEYLRRCKLLSQQGNPVGRAALVAHLYYTEPANLALHTALLAGVLDGICADAVENWTEVSTHLMVFLSHLFCRLPLHRRLQCVIESCRAHLSPSKVLLEPLPDQQRSALRAHDKDVLNVFRSYVVNYCHRAAEKLEKEFDLPLSGMSFRGTLSRDTGGDEGDFMRALQGQRLRFYARSPFVALSGHDDNFASVADLVDTVRRDIFLDWSCLPVLRRAGDNDREILLNSYLLDFYRHGQLKALYRANQIRQGEAYQLLKDFTLILRTITVALEKSPGSEHSSRAMRKLSEEFAEKLQTVMA